MKSLHHEKRSVEFGLTVNVLLIVALCLCLPLSAQTLDLDNVQYTRVDDSERNISFLVPSTAELTRADNTNFRLLGFAVEGERLLQVTWEERVAWIDVLPIAFDFRHTDWLLGHALLTDQHVINVASVINESGLPGGQMDASLQPGGFDARRSYLFVVGDRAYHISGLNDRSNFLVDLIGARFGTTVDTPWGSLGETQTVDFEGWFFPVRDDLVLTEVSNETGQVLLITDGATVSESVMVLILSSIPEDSFADQRRRFRQQMIELGFDPTAVSENQDTLVLELEASNGSSFRGMLYGGNDGRSVGLIAPIVTDAPAAWLVARHAYADAVLTLENQRSQ